MVDELFYQNLKKLQKTVRSFSHLKILLDSPRSVNSRLEKPLASGPKLQSQTRTVVDYGSRSVALEGTANSQRSFALRNELHAYRGV